MHRISKEDYARAEREIKRAAANGRISAKDARARLQEMRNMMDKPSDHGEKTDWDNIKKQRSSREKHPQAQ